MADDLPPGGKPCPDCTTERKPLIWPPAVRCGPCSRGVDESSPSGPEEGQ